MRETQRNIIQAAAALLQNANLPGWIRGSIYQGGLKNICVPGLNCYSCPGALGACPVGSLQAALGGARRGFPHYVAGLLLLFGALFGRLVCGLLCPFGLVQDLLHKIKAPRLKIPSAVDRPLRYLKYAVLLIMVIILPLAFSGSLGGGDPYFCKYLCPAGTLGGGIPLLIRNESLRAAAGFLFSWKAAVLAVILAASVFIYRPFCKYLCPLGAFYGLFNRIAVFRLRVDETRCTGCGSCESICPMQVPVLKSINSAECIRCGRCAHACPAGAISHGPAPRARRRPAE